MNNCYTCFCLVGNFFEPVGCRCIFLLSYLILPATLRMLTEALNHLSTGIFLPVLLCWIYTALLWLLMGPKKSCRTLMVNATLYRLTFGPLEVEPYNYKLGYLGRNIVLVIRWVVLLLFYFALGNLMALCINIVLWTLPMHRKCDRMQTIYF